MSYIEREAAIKAVCEGCNAEYGEEPCEPSDCTIMQTLRSIHAADVVEVRHAKDVYKQYNEHHCEFMCSLCGGWIGVIEGGNCDFNFCPNCGAEMKGEADGN